MTFVLPPYATVVVEQATTPTAWVSGPVLRSQRHQVLPSTAPTTPWLCGGWSHSGRVQLARSQGGEFEDTPLFHIQQSPRQYCAVAGMNSTAFHFTTVLPASVEHHGVQPTGCMDSEPEPSCGVPCSAFPGRPTISGSTLPRAAHQDGGTIGCNQCIPHTLWKCSGISRHTTNHLALSRMLTKHQLHPCPHPTQHSHDYHTHTPTVTNLTAFHAQL